MGGLGRRKISQRRFAGPIDDQRLASTSARMGYCRTKEGGLFDLYPSLHIFVDKYRINGSDIDLRCK